MSPDVLVDIDPCFCIDLPFNSTYCFNHAAICVFWLRPGGEGIIVCMVAFSFFVYG